MLLLMLLLFAGLRGLSGESVYPALCSLQAGAGQKNKVSAASVRVPARRLSIQPASHGHMDAEYGVSRPMHAQVASARAHAGMARYRTSLHAARLPDACFFTTSTARDKPRARRARMRPVHTHSRHQAGSTAQAGGTGTPTMLLTFACPGRNPHTRACAYTTRYEQGP